MADFYTLTKDDTTLYHISAPIARKWAKRGWTATPMSPRAIDLSLLVDGEFEQGFGLEAERNPNPGRFVEAVDEEEELPPEPEWHPAMPDEDAYLEQRHANFGF